MVQDVSKKVLNGDAKPKEGTKDTEALKGKKKEEVKKEEELSEEDQQLKSELEMLVERLKESNVALYRPSLETLRTLIRTSTTSMTSVPKPLKFLRPHYQELKEVHEKWTEGEIKRFLADIVSVLAMTYEEDGKRETLRYRLMGSSEPISDWGHEYVRHLSTEIIAEFNHLQEMEKPTDHLLKMALEITPFALSHNAEADACDLLLELESLDKLPQFVDKNTYTRVCLYLTSCVPFVAPPDDVSILKTTHAIYRKIGAFPSALQISMKLNDMEMIKGDFESCEDP
ncbi:proteasome regulatory particle base subunit, partial [Gonapodya sp. JEL0774]